MRKKNALFVISSALGHLNRAVQFAKQLREDHGYICYFVVEEKYKKFISDNSFFPILTNSSPFGIGMENVICNNSISGYLDNLILRLSNRLFYERKNDYQKWIGKLKPSFIFLDYQFEPDVVIINSILDSTNSKLFIFQTVFSFRINWDYPALFSKYLPSESWSIKIENVKFILKRKLGYALSYLKYFSFDDISLVLKNQNKSILNFRLKRNFHFYSKFSSNVPRLIMLPIELEFSAFLKDFNCEYMGFYINKNNRQGEDLDYATLIELKKKFKKAIFISLGTLHVIHTKGQSKCFFERICEVSKHFSDYLFIITLGGENFDFYNINYPNLKIFNFINQFKILKEVDLFITHGGINSILESIYQECPMLVFPLNNYFDQSGNASRVQFHEIGYSMNLSSNVGEIEKMIEHVFENYDLLKRNIKSMKLKINYNKRLSEIKF